MARGREWLVEQVRAHLRSRRSDVEEARSRLDAARRDVQALAVGLEATLVRLDRAPFRAGMTVHAAHARHPGVQAIFARHGLPRCPDCAVGADETLGEAAYGEDLDLVTLLRELDALLAFGGYEP